MLARYTLAALLLLPALVNAQALQDAAAYDAWKATLVTPRPAIRHAAQVSTPRPKGGGAPCDCWIAPDATYTLAMAPNDDLSSALLTLPFSFNLLGDQYNELYINNNGNISFDQPYSSFSADAFPSTSFVMVAPFWGDADTRDSILPNLGEVWYKMTSTALYVNWVEVGYFAMHGDKRNTFQLIITDGTDPVVPGGNNVSFCYMDMQWTTGDASFGTAGFGGVPATVGVNRGDGIEHAQIGRFGWDDDTYGGPYLDTSGVHLLDSTHFYLNTGDTAGIPPIYGSSFGCDTVLLQAGQTSILHMMVLAGGPGQLVSAAAQCPTLSAFQQLNNPLSDFIDLQVEVAAQTADIGLHTISYLAQNDAVVPLTSPFEVIVQVVAGSNGVAEQEETLFSLWPNPAADHVDVRFPSIAAVYVELLSLDGRVVRSLRSTGDRVRFELSDLAAGSYLVRATGSGGSATHRFVHAAQEGAHE